MQTVDFGRLVTSVSLGVLPGWSDSHERSSQRQALTLGACCSNYFVTSKEGSSSGEGA